MSQIKTKNIADNQVTNAKLAQMGAHTFKGNNTGSTANSLDLTATQLTAELNTVVGDSGSGGTKGLVPAPAAGDAAAGKFLKADGTFAVPPTSGTAPVSEVYLTGGNGYGSTDTKIRRLVTTVRNVGSDITITTSSDATHGCQITINTQGIYSVSYTDAISSGVGHFGVSVNSNQLTTEIASIANNGYAGGNGRICGADVNAISGHTGTVLNLNVNDVLRPHCDGLVNGTSDWEVEFRVTRIA